MATRPVYTPAFKRPYYSAENVDFQWSPGLSPAQKKKNSQAIHDGYLANHPEAKLLEVSTKSGCPVGEALSPFNLKKTIPSLKKEFPVESIYHGSKVFEKGGPYYDLLGAEPLEAKRDIRLKDSGKLVHFQLENEKYPASPDILFYNWLYISALRENPGLAREVLKYDGFTDVEFNPSTGKNCQARACAIYSSLARGGLLDMTKNFEDFKKLFLDEDITSIDEQKQPAQKEILLNDLRRAPAKRTVFSVGQWLDHPSIGKGEVIRRTKDGYLINFRVAGPRTISKDYVERHCKPIQ